MTSPPIWKNTTHTPPTSDNSLQQSRRPPHKPSVWHPANTPTPLLPPSNTRHPSATLAHDRRASHAHRPTDGPPKWRCHPPHTTPIPSSPSISHLAAWPRRRPRTRPRVSPPHRDAELRRGCADWRGRWAAVIPYVDGGARGCGHCTVQMEARGLRGRAALR